MYKKIFDWHLHRLFYKSSKCSLWRWIKKQSLQAKQESALQYKREITLSGTAVEAPFHYYYILTRIICLFYIFFDSFILTFVSSGSDGRYKSTTQHSLVAGCCKHNLSYLVVTVTRAPLWAFGVWRNQWGGDIQVALLWWLVCGDRCSSAVRPYTLAHLHTADCVQDVQWVTQTWCQTGDTDVVRNGKKMHIQSSTYM